MESKLQYDWDWDISRCNVCEHFREIDEDALEQALSAAVTCTILAAAGPQRSRVLATLYKVLISYVSMLVCLGSYYRGS